MSPQIAIFKPSTLPFLLIIVRASNNACVGCSRLPSPAFITAQFTDQASVMANIAGVKTNKAKINQRTEKPEQREFRKAKSFAKIPGAIKPNEFNYKVDADRNNPNKKDYNEMSGEELTKLSGHPYYKDKGFFPYNSKSNKKEE